MEGLGRALAVWKASECSSCGETFHCGCQGTNDVWSLDVRATIDLRCSNEERLCRKPCHAICPLANDLSTMPKLQILFLPTLPNIRPPPLPRIPTFLHKTLPPRTARRRSFPATKATRRLPSQITGSRIRNRASTLPIPVSVPSTSSTTPPLSSPLLERQNIRFSRSSTMCVVFF